MRQKGTAVLLEIEKLQVRDKEGIFNGCFRWYREETKPNDTNATFFTLGPLVDLLLFSPDSISKTEKNIVIKMLERASDWFIREYSNPILFYTNKILSDGAMLIAAGELTGNFHCVDIASDFFERWISYTENRGYRWGRT